MLLQLKSEKIWSVSTSTDRNMVMMVLTCFLNFNIDLIYSKQIFYFNFSQLKIIAFEIHVQTFYLFIMWEGYL